MIKKIIYIFLGLLLVFFVACKKEEPIILGISASNIDFNYGDVDITKLKINVIYSNNETKTINASRNNLSKEDYNSLSKVGKHKVTINLDDFSTTIFINIKSEEEFNVTIINGDDEEVLNENFKDKALIPEVSMPDKEGYTFVGMYDELGNEVKINIVREFNSNTYLIARFERNKYTVTYMDKNVLLGSETVYYGDSPLGIDEPKKDGYIFLGWSIELRNSKITEDTIVFAKFVRTSGLCHVKLLVNGEVYQELDIKYGSFLTGINDPTVDGKKFIGWDYNLNEAIFDDITINAIFEDGE